MLGLLLFVLNIYHSNADDAVQGNHATLTCPFTSSAWHKHVGNHNSNQWKRLTDDDKYDIDNISKLIIRDVNVTDSGYYLCVDCCQNKITFLDVIVYANQGATIEWTCPYTGTYYQWQRYTTNNWVTLTSNDKYGSPNALQITIRNVDFNDSGQYKCNVNGEISNTIILNVTALPTVSIRNQTYLAIIGGNVTLDCTVIGIPVASDIWWTDGRGTRLNGTRYIGGSLSSPSLTIKNVIESDSGPYTCYATNKAGTNNQSTQLKAGYAPVAKVASEQYISTTGNSVTIECTVTSADAVYWYKDNIFLNVGSIHKPQLVINNISLTDRGGYKCVVTNEFGRYSDETSLKVVNTLVPNSNYHNTANESITLLCLIYDASELKWRHNGVYIKTGSGRYSGGNITVPSLTVTQLTRYDTGIYQCESLLEYISSVSGDIELKIRDKPLVNAFQQNVVAMIGDDVIIQSSFDSYPEPTDVSWTKDEDILIVKNGAKYNGSTVQTPSLTIYNVDFTDSGIYVCFVKNSIGKSSGKSVKLNVQAEPSKSTSIEGPVAGGVSGGIVAVVLIIVAVFIYTRRKTPNSDRRGNVKLHQDKSSYRHEARNKAVYINTCHENLASVLEAHDDLPVTSSVQNSNKDDEKITYYNVDDVKTAVEEMDVKAYFAEEEKHDGLQKEYKISNQSDMNTTFTMYDIRDFMQILQDISLSEHISTEYEVLKSTPILKGASDYEIVDVKTGASSVEEYVHKAFIKKHDDDSGYIITTVPGLNDIDNFWTMITDYHVGAIVLLLQDMEKISEFFPNTIEPINTHTFKVQICFFEKIEDDIYEFILDISKKEKKTAVRVKLYKATEWKVGKKHPSIDTICKLLDVISSKETGMVALIGSKDIGFPVCGDLGACHEVLYAINNEKIFSMIQNAVGLKQVRPDLFPTFEEYNFCYKVISHFLQNEHTYAVIDD